MTGVGNHTMDATASRARGLHGPENTGPTAPWPGYPRVYVETEDGLRRSNPDGSQSMFPDSPDGQADCWQDENGVYHRSDGKPMSRLEIIEQTMRMTRSESTILRGDMFSLLGFARDMLREHQDDGEGCCTGCGCDEEGEPTQFDSCRVRELARAHGLIGGDR